MHRSDPLRRTGVTRFPTPAPLLSFVLPGVCPRVSLATPPLLAFRSSSHQVLSGLALRFAPDVSRRRRLLSWASVRSSLHTVHARRSPRDGVCARLTGPVDVFTSPPPRLPSLLAPHHVWWGQRRLSAVRAVGSSWARPAVVVIGLAASSRPLGQLVDQPSSRSSAPTNVALSRTCSAECQRTPGRPASFERSALANSWVATHLSVDPRRDTPLGASRHRFVACSPLVIASIAARDIVRRGRDLEAPSGEVIFDPCSRPGDARWRHQLRASPLEVRVRSPVGLKARRASTASPVTPGAIIR